MKRELANFEWLYADIQRSREILDKEDSQFARRVYLRALSAWYELTLSVIREETASLLIDRYEREGKLNLHEITPLLDETVMLSGNGKLHLAPNRQPFISLVAYTLKTFARLIEYPNEVLSDTRWQSFCATVKIRHRITHPKFHLEIEITDEELKVIDEGWAWWSDILESLWEQHYRYLHQPKTTRR